MKLPSLNLSFSLPYVLIEKAEKFINRHAFIILIYVLTCIATYNFLFYLNDGLGLAYNDARSHLDIGRRVVEGLKPGLAQLGSVWLPLPHILMVPTIWNDFMWHTGLAGALPSMIAFVGTGVLIYLFLRILNIPLLGRLIGVFVFATNINILYLQSTAMTELLLIGTMTAAVYAFVLWYKTEKLFHLVLSSFFIMCATLIRYDGWFLLIYVADVIVVTLFRKKAFRKTEGTAFFFLTLSSFGIILWFLWNLLIFKDPLYFALGPYSAHAQQQQLAHAGNLATKGNLPLSFQMYFYALAYSCNFAIVMLGILGSVVMWFDRKLDIKLRLALSSLYAPLLFNVLALYLGHSVLYIQGLSGNTWFNVRYGVLMIPSFAIFIGYLVTKAKSFRYIIIGFLLLITVFAYINKDAVTIDDARVGSSQKNVTEVSGWLYTHARDKKGFILISAASHDAIIFSSGLPMKRFIHEGTGKYWESATTSPDRWARWIIMRTYDNNDATYKLVSKSPGFKYYSLVAKYPFADIYELKSAYLNNLQTDQVYTHQK